MYDEVRESLDRVYDDLGEVLNRLQDTAATWDSTEFRSAYSEVVDAGREFQEKFDEFLNEL